MSGRIDQILAGFAEGDAISHEARVLRAILLKWGFASEIFVEDGHISPAMRHECRPLSTYAGAPGDVVIHHYSIASGAVDVFCSAPGKKVVVYHNVTPPEFYQGFDDGLAARLAEARARLPDVLRVSDAIWADSAFNAREIEALGIGSVRVFPLIFSVEVFEYVPDARIMQAFAGAMRNVLFVGRIAPNKRVEELVLGFAYYHYGLNRQSRLILVGSDRSAPRYYLMLRMLARELGLTTVCFERYASPAGLCAYYRCADVFVTASEHEGYCLPLVEAMHMRVPVIAKKRGGMPETLASAGILYDEASPEELAVLIHRTIEDERLRGEVLRSQERRMTQIRSRNVEGELRALLAEIGFFRNGT
ncbi:MAG: glycosyltransferase [Kiritimatiellia bacterium]